MAFMIMLLCLCISANENTCMFVRVCICAHAYVRTPFNAGICTYDCVCVYGIVALLSIWCVDVTIYRSAAQLRNARASCEPSWMVGWLDDLALRCAGGRLCSRCVCFLKHKTWNHRDNDRKSLGQTHTRARTHQSCKTRDAHRPSPPTGC